MEKLSKKGTGEDLLRLAESGEWKDRAIELLQEKTDARMLLIHEFVNDWWQNLLSDEDNIENFKDFVIEAEQSDSLN